MSRITDYFEALRLMEQDTEPVDTNNLIRVHSIGFYASSSRPRKETPEASKLESITGYF